MEIENQDMEGTPTPTNIFSALGIKDPNPAPASNNDAANESDVTPSSTDDSEGNGADVNTGTQDEPVFKATDLKSIFGDFESIDNIKEQYTSLSEKAKKYEEYEPFIKDQETLMKELESPFANEKLASLNSFIKATGVNDLDVANKFVGKTSDDLKNSPIQTMALAEVIKDPALLKNMTFQEICETIAEEHNTYVDADGDSIPKTLKMKLGRYVDTVEEKLQNITQNQDFVASLRNKFSEQEQTVQKLVGDWNPIVAEATKMNELQLEVDGVKFKAPVSETTLKQVQQEVMNIIQASPSIPDEANINAIKSFVSARIEAIEAKNIYKALANAVRGEARESALKEFHNGSEIRRSEKPDGSSDKSMLQKYFESQQ
jgi:hypothetical protein